jgi:hypothetical protein
MKRSICGIFIALLALTACGKTETEPREFETPARREGAISVPVTERQDVPESAPEANKRIEPSQEILAAELFDPLIQVGNTVLSLPADYGDLITAGAVNVDDKYIETYLMDAGMHVNGVEFQIMGTKIKADMHNNTTDRIQLHDCVIGNLYSSGGGELFYPGGVHVGLGMTELVSAWGEPLEESGWGLFSSDEYLRYWYIHEPYAVGRLLDNSNDALLSSSGNQYDILIKRDDQRIFSISRTFTNTASAGALREHDKETNGVRLCYSVTDNFYSTEFAWGGKLGFILSDTKMSLMKVNDTAYIASMTPPGFFRKSQRSDALQEMIDLINIPPNGWNDPDVYEIKVLSNENDAIHCAGYRVENNVLHAKGGFAADEKLYYPANGKIFPLDPDDVITQEAQTAFKELFDAFVMSMYIAD